MEPSIYSFSLCAALPLMLFFGFYFLFAKTPEKKIFKNYLRSRQIMGIAMLLLSANYSVHFFFGIRFKNADSAILMNMSTYFLCYSLFSSALIMLLDRFYITKRRVWTHIILWIIFSTLSGVVLFLLPSGIMQKISLFALAVWLIVFGVVLARRVIIAYRRAIRIFNETQADDIGTYIEWLSIFTYWAVIFGVGCGLLTFLPDKYVFIWILSSIPFYSYLFYSYQNYLLFYEQVENAFEQDIQSEEELLTNSETEHEIVSEKKPSCFMATASQLPVRIEHTLYTCIEPNRLIEHDPVSVAINMNTKEEKKLPFDYPDYPGSEVKLKRYGMEASYSRCYDGQRFIYSFHYDENIYVATPEHDSIRKVSVKSKYFDKVQLPDELTASPEDFCVNAWYNNLLYDPYREVYYRIAYPPSTLDKGVRPMELVQFGRKNFSIIILDKDFRILGETLFPDNTYNPTIMLVRPEGLYISDSHYLNPQFNDDILSFRKFELKEE